MVVMDRHLTELTRTQTPQVRPPVIVVDRGRRTVFKWGCRTRGNGQPGGPECLWEALHC